MTSANDMQIGGKHYAGGYQHWDWVIDNNIGYLEAAASKYITRHKNKNGLQDLEKSHHYISKTIEAVEEHRYENNLTLPTALSSINTHRFIHSAGLDQEQGILCALLSSWAEPGDLKVALNILHEYMRPLKEAADGPLPLPGAATAKPPAPATSGRPPAVVVPWDVPDGGKGMRHPFGYPDDE